jgi:hypothetical protein
MMGIPCCFVTIRLLIHMPSAFSFLLALCACFFLLGAFFYHTKGVLVVGCIAGKEVGLCGWLVLLIARQEVFSTFLSFVLPDR